MAVTFGASGTAANGTTTCNPTYPASVGAGDYLIAIIGSGNSANDVPTAPDGSWTLLASGANTDGTWGIGTGPRRGTLYGKEAAGTETGSAGNFAIATGVSNSLIVVRIERYDKSTANPWIVTTGSAHYENANGTSTALSFAGIPLNTGDAVYLGTGGPSSGTAYSGQAFAQSGITFGTVTERVDSGQTNGNDMRVHACSAEVTAGAGTGTLSFSMTQDASLGGALVVLSDAVSTQSVAIGIASETDTALAVTPTAGVATVTLGIAAESDTALAVTAVAATTVTLGIASETDTALAATATPGAATVALGLASEADTALAVTPTPGGATVALGVATESDTALAITPSTGAGVTPIGVAVEVDVALAMTPTGGPVTVQTGIAAESDSALAMVASRAERERTMASGGGDYGGIGSIIKAAMADRAAELNAPPVACPTHGEPLDIGPDGVRSCPFGDYTFGVRPPHLPLGLR